MTLTAPLPSSLTQFAVLLVLVYLSGAIHTSAQEIPHRQRVINQDEIIALPVSKFTEPECSYTVHHGSSDGPRVTAGISIGDPLYHKWRCEYGTNAGNVYCIMIHNCTVSNSENRGSPQSSAVEIIDEFGCSLYPQVMPHVEYLDDLSAGLKANAFALDIDQEAVFFKCTIKLLLKLNGVCRRPQCVPLSRFNRRERVNG